MAQNQRMSVQVQDGKLRDDPSFLGKIVASVAYGDAVTVIRQQDPWLFVSVKGGQSGWIHSSALTEKEIVLRAGDANVQKSASQREIALAGKGFNPEVEREYKKRNPNLDFEEIDRMEKIVVSDEEIRQFIKDGKLMLEGGRP
ncbi:MAG: SH3 domain-containing protein [Deltaproteobacteria bacterium]|nr:SH3 domain-containing protein [Deltaproteobacteria bacterium]